MVTLMVRARLLANPTIALLCGVLLSATLWAQNHTASVLIDADNNAATGCTVTTASGVVNGVNARLDAAINLSTAQVDSVGLSLCSGGSFGAAQSLPASFPVGTYVQDGSLATVELGLDASLVAPISNGQRWNLDYLLSAADGSSDLAGPGLLQFAIAAAIATPVPALGLLALAALGLGVGGLALHRLPRQLSGVLRSGITVVVLAGLVSAVWAANLIQLDGNRSDWTAAPLALDPSGDPTGLNYNVDLAAVYATHEGQQVFFRFDLVEPICGIFFNGDYTECLKGRLLRQDSGNDGSFEESWYISAGTASGDDGLCPVGTSFAGSEVGNYESSAPAFWQFMIDHGFVNGNDFCTISPPAI